MICDKLRSVRVLILILIGVVLPIFGCGAKEPLVEQVMDETYKVDPDSTLSVRNADGAIHIFGGSTNELKVHAVKKAYSANRLEKISINISIGTKSVSIDTHYPPRPKWRMFDRSGTVDYSLVVPQSCKIESVELANGEVSIEGMRGPSLNANLVNGRMVGRNCFGNVRLSVVNGGIDLGFDWWEKRASSIAARVVNGNTRAFIPASASLHLLATSANGKIDNEFSAQQDRNGTRMHKVDMTIGNDNDAGTDLQIHTTNGDVKIAQMNP